MLEGGIGGDLDDDVGLNSDDVDLLAAPVADVAAADDRRPRVIVARGDEQRCQLRLLNGGERRGAADDLQHAVAVEAEDEPIGVGEGAVTAPTMTSTVSR